MGNLRRFSGTTLFITGIIILITSAVSSQTGGSGNGANSTSAVTTTLKAVKRTQDPARRRERAQARIDAAIAIVNRFESEAKARGLGSGWRQASLETLLPLSLDALRQIDQQAFRLAALSDAVREAASDPNLVGDPDADLSYTPIMPCRFIDTRFYIDGKINGVRGFDIDNTGATYGASGACAPASLFGVSGTQIGALAMNVTVFDTADPPAPGFVAVKPTAASPTTSLLNWYDRGPTVQVANQGIVSLFQGGGSEFVIETSGSVHIIVDIFGAFIAPETALQHVIVADSVPVANGANGALSSPACPTKYTLTGGSCTSFQLNHLVTVDAPSTGPTSATWFCASTNNSGIASALSVYAVCTRPSGR
jgi:hypothetical protein